MIDYVVHFQNNYVSSYLFRQNLPILMLKGVDLSELFESSVFMPKFYF